MICIKVSSHAQYALCQYQPVSSGRCGAAGGRDWYMQFTTKLSR